MISFKERVLPLISLWLLFNAQALGAADLRPEEIVTVLPKDAIPAILSPAFEDGAKVSWLGAKDLVVGVEIGGHSRAYPVPTLSRHEIVNDIVGGIPIAVTWCPLCYTAIVYDRRIGGRELTFGVSGKLHANSLIMYDHQTDSLWSHLVGAAVTGPLKGEKLIPIQSMFTRWETWKGLHPAAKVLSNGKRSLFGSLRDPYESYYRSAETGIIPPRRLDKRIYPKEFVLGLILGSKAKAYPFSVLSRNPLVNDVFEGVPLLVVFAEESATGTIFQRKLEGKTLSFKKAQSLSKKDPHMLDSETGSVWEGLTGRAMKGKLQGKKLTPLPATPSFWFGWVDHYPNTELYLPEK